MNNSRFKDLPWAKFLQDLNLICTVGGAGGISSWTSLLLTRAGIIPYVFDADTVEYHNLGGQLFSVHSVGYSKVEALQALIRKLTGETIYIESEMIKIGTVCSEICIAGFDQMKARKDFFENWKNHISTLPLDSPELQRAIYIDGRLLAEQFQIFTIKGTDKEAMQKYETEYLFDDSEVASEACTSKQTSHIAAMIGSYIVSILTNHLTNVSFGRTVRKIPFTIEVHTSILSHDIQ